MQSNRDITRQWYSWLLETLVLIAKHQGPEQREEIPLKSKRCPLRKIIPRRRKRDTDDQQQ